MLSPKIALTSASTPAIPTIPAKGVPDSLLQRQSSSRYWRVERDWPGHRWHGYRELEDHQMGSKAQFFDQKFEPRNISVEIAGDSAIAKTEVQWNARHWSFPAARSQEIKAIYFHTWTIKRSAAMGKPVVAVNHVDHMKYVEGYEPATAQARTDPHLGKEV